MADISQTNWTEVDAQNNYAAPLGWTPGTMLPSQVEPTAQMMMGALKRFWNRANPIYAAVTSVTDVYTATPNVPITSLTAFEEFHVRFSGPNLTTSPAFVFANTAQQTIKKYSMSSLTALSPGDIQGHAHRLYWDNTQMILANPTSGSGSPFPPTVTVSATTGTFVNGGPNYSIGTLFGSSSNTAVMGNDLRVVNALQNTGATTQVAPSNPPGTATTSAYVMTGMGSVCAFTPSYSTRAMAWFQFTGSNSGSGGGFAVHAQYGTGIAPVSGVALTGTRIGNSNFQTNVFGPGATCGGAIGGLVTGLSPGTAYWFDLAEVAVSTGIASLSGITFTVTEI